jgi:hypothetical protein
MKATILSLVALLALPGCASLHLRSSDSTGTKIAKGVARVPVAVLTFGMSEAWHQRERAMESWLGHHESELLMSWGAPHSVLEDGRGGRILVYTENRTYVQPGQATTTSTANAYGYAYGNQAYVHGQGQSYTTYTPAQVHQWQVYRQFRVGSSGRIIEYSWRGL